MPYRKRFPKKQGHFTHNAKKALGFLLVNISMSSCFELEYLIELSSDRFAEFSEHCLSLKKMLVSLFKKRKGSKANND